MNDIRYIKETEFEITPQVLYNTAYMSLPEFQNYYMLLLKIKPDDEVKSVIEGIWEDLKLITIRKGVNKTLRKSNLAKLRTERVKTAPKVKRGRGRPKK